MEAHEEFRSVVRKTKKKKPEIFERFVPTASVRWARTSTISTGSLPASRRPGVRIVHAASRRPAKNMNFEKKKSFHTR